MKFYNSESINITRDVKGLTPERISDLDLTLIAVWDTHYFSILHPSKRKGYISIVFDGITMQHI